MSTASDERGFLAFYREYAHTGIHSVTATALTAFGLLTFVHRGFVVLAIAVYVLPPIYLYLTRDDETPESVEDEETTTGDTTANRPDGTGLERSGDETGRGAAEPDATSEPARLAESREETGETPGTTPPGSATGQTETGPRSSEPDADDGDEPAAAGVTDADEGSVEWIEVDSPTEETLFDAVAAGNSAYAAGGNGVLLAREDEWELALEDGPAAESTTLRGVDATDGGEAVWVAGDSGVLGRYDPTTTRHTDHSAPEGITDNWADLAVAGAADEERIALVNGSGQVLLGEYDGTEVEWGEPTKPGSGSSMSAIEFVDESTGYCCDTNAGVYEFNGAFERIGVEDGGAFTALAATERLVAVADDAGIVRRFDGTVWTPLRASENALSGIDTDSEEWLAVGAGGTIYENDDGDWESAESPVDTALYGVAVGDPPVAVGEAGTLLERL